MSDSMGSRGIRSLGQFRLTGKAMTPGTKDLLLGTIVNVANNENDEAYLVGTKGHSKSRTRSGHVSDKSEDLEG